MCVMATPLIAAALAGSSAAGTLGSAYASSITTRRAALAREQQAKGRQKRAVVAEEGLRREARAALGDAAARQSRSGIRTDQGTSLTQAADLAQSLEFDILRARDDEAFRVQTLRNNAVVQRGRASAALYRGILQTLPGLVRSGGSALTNAGSRISVPRSSGS